MLPVINIFHRWSIILINLNSRPCLITFFLFVRVWIKFIAPVSSWSYIANNLSIGNLLQITWLARCFYSEPSMWYIFRKACSSDGKSLSLISSLILRNGSDCRYDFNVMVYILISIFIIFVQSRLVCTVAIQCMQCNFMFSSNKFLWPASDHFANISRVIWRNGSARTITHKHTLYLTDIFYFVLADEWDNFSSFGVDWGDLF